MDRFHNLPAVMAEEVIMFFFLNLEDIFGVDNILRRDKLSSNLYLVLFVLIF